MQQQSDVSYESMLVDSSTFMDAVSNVFPSKSSKRPAASSEQPVNNNIDRDNSAKMGPKADVVMEDKRVSEQTAKRPPTPAAPVAPAAPAAQVITPPKPKTRIEAFSTPPDEGGGTSTGADVKKTRIGFNSSLPQPAFLFGAPAPEKATNTRANEPSLLDVGSEPKLNAPVGFTAPKQQAPAAKESTPTATTEKNSSEQQSNTSDMTAELEKLTKLLADMTLLPDAAASYLKDRKEELENKLFSKPPAAKPEERRGPSQTPAAAVKQEQKGFEALSSNAGRPAKTAEHVPSIKQEKKNFEGVASNVGRAIKMEERDSPKPMASIPLHKENKEKSADTLPNAQRVFKPEGQSTFASQPSASRPSVGEKKNDEKSKLFDLPDFAKFAGGDTAAHSSRSMHDSNRGKENTERRSSIERTPRPNQRRRPKKTSVKKADDLFGQSSAESNDGDNIIGEYLLPGRGDTRPMSQASKQQNNAEKSVASRHAKTPSSASRDSPAANSKPNDGPNFPITAATMQYYKGPLPQEMKPKPTSTDKASAPPAASTARMSAKPEPATAKERQPATQPNKGVSFELPTQPKREMRKNAPISAATLQYFKGDASSPSAGSSDTATSPTKRETKTAGAKPASQGKHDCPVNQASRAPAHDVPNFPISAATMQYAKTYFPDNEDVMRARAGDGNGNRSTASSSRNKSPDRPRPKAQPKRRTVFSPDASPFNPNSPNKENSKPAASGSTLFQERMEKKGVSVDHGNGLSASKWAH